MYLPFTRKMDLASTFIMEQFRGNEIYKSNGEYLYKDSDKPVSENWQTTNCGHCNLPFTPEGHDGCIGTLPNVLNACCGHGITQDAYVQFEDRTIRGQEAIDYINNKTNEINRRTNQPGDSTHT